MKLATFEAICTALNNEGVRFLVAGGLAVNAHGYLRLTQALEEMADLAQRLATMPRTTRRVTKSNPAAR